jgi:uncharacterized protein
MVKKFFILILLVASIFIQVPGIWAEEDDLTQKKRALCEEGNSTACFQMGERYRIVERDQKTALKFYIKACDKGYMTGCTNGGILLIMKGTPYSKEFKQARKMFGKACEAGEDPSCFNMGSLNYKEGRQKKALQYYLKACDMGNNAGCAKHKRLSR